jgi:hypothetical protein
VKDPIKLGLRLLNHLLANPFSNSKLESNGVGGAVATQSSGGREGLYFRKVMTTKCLGKQFTTLGDWAKG